MKKIKNIIKKVLKIYKIIMRIRKYIDFKLMIEDFKKENPDNDVFGKPKKRSEFTQYLMDNEDGIERAEKTKKQRNLEKRSDLRRYKKWRSDMQRKN
jgi:hypothetical protein